MVAAYNQLWMYSWLNVACELSSGLVIESAPPTLSATCNDSIMLDIPPCHSLIFVDISLFFCHKPI